MCDRGDNNGSASRSSRVSGSCQSLRPSQLSRSSRRGSRCSDKALFNLSGWIVAILASTVYLLTLEPTASFWDCGEFIATSYGLQVGHPPGAPLYTLLAHCMTLLAGDPQQVAWWSNALSALAGGVTAMFHFWTVARLVLGLTASPSDGRSVGNALYAALYAAAVGTGCYLFCDTAWFSAVESEVYSLSMLFSSAIVWAAVRWSQPGLLSGSAPSDGVTPRHDPRWLMLVALLAGLSVCVHQLSLLTLPCVLLVCLLHRGTSRRHRGRYAAWALLFFVIGLSPYAIIPIRAAADPPINMGCPASARDFKAYFTREQYEHAPLLYGRCFNSPVVGYEDGKPVYAKEMDMFFPRMWKQHPNAELYYTDWCGRHGTMVDVDGRQYYKPSFGDNMAIFAAYQLGYMNLRYLMWNFSGRYNDRQGFGNLQKGQFVTGIPFIDRQYVGTSARQPDSLPNKGHNRYFLLPFILGIVGVFALFKRNKKYGWSVLTLFLTSGLLLSIYLNHPMYEPRERDYAYILSFYAFAVWIGIGAYAIGDAMANAVERRRERRALATRRGPLCCSTIAVLLLVPLLVACQNWDDHDRSGRFVARDSAENLLNSCAKNAILFTAGDNDTFPLWYLQQVEGVRTDVQVVNLSLLGSDSYCHSVLKGMGNLDGFVYEGIGPYRRMMALIDVSADDRPVFFSHYAAADRRVAFDGRMRLCGMAYRLDDTVSADSVDRDGSYALFTSVMGWHPLQGVYIDEVSCSFLRQYWRDAMLVAENLAAAGEEARAREVLDSTLAAVPPQLLSDPLLLFAVAQSFAVCGDTARSQSLLERCRSDVGQQVEYYSSVSESLRRFIPYTLAPVDSLAACLGINPVR